MKNKYAHVKQRTRSVEIRVWHLVKLLHLSKRAFGKFQSKQSYFSLSVCAHPTWALNSNAHMCSPLRVYGTSREPFQDGDCGSSCSYGTNLILSWRHHKSNWRKCVETITTNRTSLQYCAQVMLEIRYFCFFRRSNHRLLSLQNLICFHFSSHRPFTHTNKHTYTPSTQTFYSQMESKSALANRVICTALTFVRNVFSLVLFYSLITEQPPLVADRMFSFVWNQSSMGHEEAIAGEWRNSTSISMPELPGGQRPWEQ